MPTETVGATWAGALEGGLAMPSFAAHAASRRKFLKFLAGSPLLAAGGAFAGEGPMPGTKLPDPLMWAPLRADELIKSPKEAIQRLRLRAGVPAQRSAGAFRLHGLRHR